MQQGQTAVCLISWLGWVFTSLSRGIYPIVPPPQHNRVPLKPFCDTKCRNFSLIPAGIQCGIVWLIGAQSAAPRQYS